MTGKRVFSIKNILWCFVLWGFVGCQSLKPKVLEKQVEVVHPDKEKKPELGFLKTKAPKLGLVLGAGGTLSFAHIGFLRELEKQKIPVHAIVGLEWGSLVAAAYALKAKAHAIEWKLLKLPVEKFAKKSFFKKSWQAAKISKMNGFLKDVFSKSQFSDLKLPFACPFADIKKERVRLRVRGSVMNGLKVCWPYPPHFHMETQMAEPNAVFQAVEFLKNQGAELIVYVDVSSSNFLFDKKDQEQKPWQALMWTQHKGLVSKGSFADETLRLSLSGSFINSYESLRALVRMGQLKSRPWIRSFSKKYAY